MSRRPNRSLFARPAAAPAPAAAGHRPLLLAVALAAGFTALPVRAQPSGAQAVVGGATLSQQGSTLVVTTQNGANGFSALNWQSFSIPKGTATQFVQPNAASTSLNRVIGPDPSLIYGTLSSNGRLVLVNPNGITVGAGAVVDTAAFTASTLRMTDADMLAGRMRFADPVGGLLKVDGQVLARSGDVVLIGRQVETGAQALVHSPQGATVLAAGQKVEVTGRGLEGIVFEVQAPANQAVNLGTLRGDAVGVFAGTLRHSGLVQAQAVSTEGGRVVLKAAGSADVAGGAVQAQALAGRGGQVDVLGTQVALTQGAAIDASGATGGGTVRIGGDYRGANAALPNAQHTVISNDSIVRANATDSGDGGRVIVWADGTTRAHGRLEAKAGPQGGDGGFIETSGKRWLDVSGISIDASSARGTAGNWLLDPADIVIVHGSGEYTPLNVAVDGPPTTSVPMPSIVTDGTLNAAIDNATSVTIATSDYSGSGVGDITFSGSSGTVDIKRSVAGSHTITFDAARNINFSGGDTSFSAANGSTLKVVLAHGTTGATQVESGGTVSVGSGTALSTPSLLMQGGNLTVAGATAAAGLTVDTLSIAGGELKIDSGGSLAVNRGIGATGGTFTFQGADLSVRQAAGDLVVPGATGTIQASGSVSLVADDGGVFVNRTVDSAGNVTLQGTGEVRFTNVRTTAGGNVEMTGASIGSSNDTPTTISTSRSRGGKAGNVKLTSTAGEISVGSIEAIGSTSPVGGGDVTLSATGGNITLGSVQTQGVTAGVTTASAGGNVSLTSTHAVLFSSIQTSGVLGGRGGAVDITAASVASAPSTSAFIHTAGVSTQGGGVTVASRGGDVTITATDGGITIGSINTRGAQADFGNGSGGNVTLSAHGGMVSLGFIAADAGQAASSASMADAGDVSIRTTGPADLGKIDLGIVSAQGAKAGGSGGDVTIVGTGDIRMDAARVSQATHVISTRSQAGSGPVSTGNITVVSSGGSVTLLGHVETSGPGVAGGTIGSIHLSAGTGKDLVAGNVTAIAESPAVETTTALTGASFASGASGGQIGIYAGGNIGLGAVLSNGSNNSAGDGGHAGSITIDAKAGSVTAGHVQAIGGSGQGGQGGNAGAITITGAAGIDLGSVAASGGDGSTGGGTGGSVTLSSSGGYVVVKENVFSSGGDATTGMGGHARAIRITAGAEAPEGTVQTGGLFAVGGSGDIGGNGGDITVDATGNVSVTGPKGGAILAQGGNGFMHTGTGGNVSVVSSGGGITAIGAIQTFAGAQTQLSLPMEGGSAGSVDLRAGTSVQVIGNVSAWGSAGWGVMGRGGDVTIVAGAGDLTVNNIDTRGSIGHAADQTATSSLGGRGGSVTLTASGGNLVAGNITAYGGAGITEGSRGGDVLVTVTDGSATLGHISTFAGSGSQKGGTAGNVTITASGTPAGSGNVLTAGASTATADVTVGDIDAEGGWGGAGTAGNGGTVALTGHAVTAGEIQTYGGSGLSGGDAGSVTITSGAGEVWVDFINTQAGHGYGSATTALSGTVGISGGGMVTVGAIQTDGAWGQAGGTAGDIRISTAGDISITGATSSRPGISALGGSGSLGSGGGGGNVTLSSSGGNVTVARAETWGGWGTAGGGLGGDVTIDGRTVSIGYLDASGGGSISTAGAGGTGGTIQVTARDGVTFRVGDTLGEVMADGGFGIYSGSLGSAGGMGGIGGNITVTVTHGNLDLSDAFLSARGGAGGSSYYATGVGGAGGRGGAIVLEATRGSVITNGSAAASGGTAITADGGSGGHNFSESGAAGVRGGTGGKAGTIRITSGSTARLIGDISASGGAGGAVSNAPGAQAVGGTGGEATTDAITVTVTGAGQDLELGGRVNASAGIGGLASIGGDGDGGGEESESLRALALDHPVPDLTRSGANGAGVGRFTATVPGRIIIPVSTDTPTTGEVLDILSTSPSLAINADWTNTGTLLLNPGAWVVSAQPFTNAGGLHLGQGSVFTIGSLGIAPDGNLALTAGTGTLTNGSTGVIAGVGTIDASLVNAGTVAPGSAGGVGILSVTGGYQQTSTGRLLIDAAVQGPYGPGTNQDQLRAVGAVKLGGELVVNGLDQQPQSQVTRAVDGPQAVRLAAELSDSVVFLDAPGGVEGQFASMTGPAALTARMAIQNGATVQDVSSFVAPAPPPSATPTPPPPPAPASTPVLNISNAAVVLAAAQLAPGAPLTVVQTALTEQTSSVVKGTTPPKDESKDEKKEAAVITTDTSCKPG
jgi:filamentous hemagglutinin family protein